MGVQVRIQLVCLFSMQMQCISINEIKFCGQPSSILQPSTHGFRKLNYINNKGKNLQILHLPNKIHIRVCIMYIVYIVHKWHNGKRNTHWRIVVHLTHKPVTDYQTLEHVSIVCFIFMWQCFMSE